MKKIILASVMAVSAVSSIGVAHAESQSFCDAATVGGAGASAVLGTVASNSFIKATFTPKCSVNTIVHGSDFGLYYKVGSTSIKGKSAFAGSSAGGGVVVAGTCGAATACAASDVTAAMATTYAATS